MKESEKKIGYKDVFRQTEYLKMILAALINRFGDSIDAIASTWIVYELTGNAAWSAVIFGMNKVPTVLITPLAGAWVEGRRKKTIMVVTDIIRAACVAFVATGYLFGFLQAWMLLLTTFTISTVEAFRGPAGNALTPRILKKEYYEYGLSLMSTLSSIMELIGTMVAAGVIAVLGTSGAIYLDMATFLASAFIISFVKVKETNLSKQLFDKQAYFNNLKEGFGYVKTNRAICYMLLIVIFLNAILVPLNSLQAPMATELLHGGAEILSILGVALTVGMLCGSATYPMLKAHMSGKAIMAFSVFTLALFYLILPICEPLFTNDVLRYVAVVLAALLFGYAIALCDTYVNVGSIKYINEEYLARASGVLTAGSSLATPVVSFVVGALVAYVSTAQCFIVAGVCAALEGVWILVGRGIEENAAQDTDAAEKTGAAEV